MPIKFIGGGSGYCIELADGREVYRPENDKPLSADVEHAYPDYSLYPELTKDTAYGFLTRGCPRNCGFCHTTQKDGSRSVKVADLNEFWSGQKNIVLLDQNILACKQHNDLLDQLITSRAKVEFNGGLDVRLVSNGNIERIRKVRINKVIHLAFDRYQDKDIVEPKLRMFMEATGYDHHKVMCYVLTNFDTTIEQDMYRIQLCRELNIQPFVMIYDKAHADPVYKAMQRWCNPFIFWKVPTFDEYTRGKRGAKP